MQDDLNQYKRQTEGKLVSRPNNKAVFGRRITRSQTGCQGIVMRDKAKLDARSLADKTVYLTRSTSDKT